MMHVNHTINSTLLLCVYVRVSTYYKNKSFLQTRLKINRITYSLKTKV